MFNIYIPSVDEDLTETGQFTLPEFCNLLQKYKENPSAIEWLAEMLSCANVEALTAGNCDSYEGINKETLAFLSFQRGVDNYVD